jgi:Ferritin-like domain
MTIQANQSEIDRPAKRAGRRDFLRGLGLGAAGAAAFGATALSQTNALAAAAPPNLDVAILEFALNLEYLEAEFYLRAATGVGLSPALLGPGAGPITGGSKVPFTMPLVKAYAQEIADEEQKHVEYLRAALTALTGSVISAPAIDFTESFSTLASAAGLGEGFNAFQNDTTFLLAAYVFEDVGVTAYHGAAPLISNKAILDKPPAFSRSRPIMQVSSEPSFLRTGRRARQRRSPTSAPSSTAPLARRMWMIVVSARCQRQRSLTRATLSTDHCLAAFPPTILLETMQSPTIARRDRS